MPMGVPQGQYTFPSLYFSGWYRRVILSLWHRSTSPFPNFRYFHNFFLHLAHLMISMGQLLSFFLRLEVFFPKQEGKRYKKEGHCP